MSGSAVEGVSRGKRWLLIQSRIEYNLGMELRACAEEEGMRCSTYLRRLVLMHLRELREKRGEKVADRLLSVAPVGDIVPSDSDIASQIGGVDGDD